MRLMLRKADYPLEWWATAGQWEAFIEERLASPKAGILPAGDLWIGAVPVPWVSSPQAYL